MSSSVNFIMEDRAIEVEYPVALEPKQDDMRCLTNDALEMPKIDHMKHLTNDVLEMPKTDDMRHLANDLLEMPQVEDMRCLTNDVLEMEYPVVEEHIVEFHEIFEEGQANREENGNDRRLYCKYCGKNFKSHNYVKMHERWHRGELSHHCPECNRAFRYPSELKKHTTIHTGQLPYKCEECDLRFNKAQAAHEHRLRDHVGMNAAQGSKSLQPPIVLQMNNNYQPMSFEVVLPNLHTQTQGRQSDLERDSDPLTEGFAADRYPQPASMPRSSVIKPNYSYGKEVNYKELNYACSKELNYKEPNYACSKEFNYKEPNYACSKELNYGGRQENIEGAGTARLEEPKMWREMQFGRNCGSNDDIEDGGEATDGDLENMDDVDKNEECRKCRRIMEYENKIGQLRNHHCS